MFIFNIKKDLTMISTKYRQQIYPIFIIGIFLMFFLGGCSSSNEDLITPIEKAAVRSIIGEVIATNGTPIDAATVDLDALTELRVVTDSNGKFTISPPFFDDYQLIISKEGFVTQYKNISVSDSGVSLKPIVLKRIDKIKQIDGNIGGDIAIKTVTGSKIEVDIPAGASNELTEIKMTLLTGAEIPSDLPAEEGKTLLPIGVLVVGMTPVDTVLTIPAEGKIPVPIILQETDRTFDVYELNNGVWDLYRKNLKNNPDNKITFPILKAGSYMVTSTIPNTITPDSANIESDKTIEVLETSKLDSGDTIEKTVADTLQISGTEDLPKQEKAEIEALITSLLEKQLETKFGIEHKLFLTAPDIEKTTKKLFCSTKLVQTTQVYTFNFNIPGFGKIVITVITVSTYYSQICEDDGQPNPTGAVGGSS